jgi:hypothetical protein
MSCDGDLAVLYLSFESTWRQIRVCIISSVVFRCTEVRQWVNMMLFLGNFGGQSTPRVSLMNMLVLEYFRFYL